MRADNSRHIVAAARNRHEHTRAKAVQALPDYPGRPPRRSWLGTKSARADTAAGQLRQLPPGRWPHRIAPGQRAVVPRPRTATDDAGFELEIVKH